MSASNKRIVQRHAEAARDFLQRHSIPLVRVVEVGLVACFAECVIILDFRQVLSFIDGRSLSFAVIMMIAEFS